MVSLAAVALSAYLVLVFGIIAAYVYLDAPTYGMDPLKWAVIAFAVPIFGAFAYLLERSERTESADREMFEDGTFEIHESRADDTRLVANTDTDEVADEEGAEEP
jgi:hypothetical protein